MAYDVRRKASEDAVYFNGRCILQCKSTAPSSYLIDGGVHSVELEMERCYIDTAEVLDLDDLVARVVDSVLDAHAEQLAECAPNNGLALDDAYFLHKQSLEA